MTGKATEISTMLAPTVAALGLELLGIELAAAGSDAKLTLYIDAPGRPVDIDDCERVSREVSAQLDVEDPIASQYTLEVSSPGIDRPLFTAAQFGRWIGEKAKLTLRLAQDGRRRFQATILGVENDDVLLAHEAGNMRVPHSNIEKARLVPDLVALGLAPQPKPGKAPAGRRKAATKKDEES